MTTKTCSALGCGQVVLAKNMCKQHYYRWYRNRDVDAPIRQWGQSLMDVIAKVEPTIVAAIDREAFMTNSSRYRVLRAILADWYTAWQTQHGQPTEAEVVHVFQLREARRHVGKMA